MTYTMKQTCSLILMGRDTHTHTHTHTHTQHTRVHTQTHTQTPTQHTHAHTHTHSHAVLLPLMINILGTRNESWLSVQEFLKKLPTYGLEPVDCGSLTLDAPQIAAIEKAVLDMQVCVFSVLGTSAPLCSLWSCQLCVWMIRRGRRSLIS